MEQPARLERTIITLGVAISIAIIAGGVSSYATYKMGYKQATTEAEVKLALKDKEVAEAKAKSQDRSKQQPEAKPLTVSSLSAGDLSMVEGFTTLSGTQAEAALWAVNNTLGACDPCMTGGLSVASCIKERGNICTSMSRLATRAARLAREGKPKEAIQEAITYREPWVQIDASALPIKGNKTAPVLIAEYTDFQCPYCVKSQETLKNLAAKYGDKVRFTYGSFPLSMHKLAEPAARAATAAGLQGKFWEYHDQLFQRVKEFNNEGVWEKIATDIGINGAKLKADMDSQAVIDTVKRDMSTAAKYGVRSTPTFFVNGYRVKGNQPIENFERIIDLELQDMGLK